MHDAARRSPAPDRTYLTFQHCPQEKVRHELLEKVHNYKRILLERVVSIFQELGIPYSLDAGNLLESLRGELIPHDDDLDVRFDHRHWDKWAAYCTSSLQKLPNSQGYADMKRKILFDKRAQNFKDQQYNGIQASLMDVENPFPPSPPGTTICEPLHMDIVTSNPGIDFWPNVNYFFEEPLDLIEYYGIQVNVPKIHIREQYLTQLYGKNYMSPDIPSKRDSYGYYRLK